jgi:hypothetical protein
MEFPILGTRFTIPWEAIARHEKQAMSNHGQTIKRLAERGGLDWVEVLSVMEDRKWIRMDPDKARKRFWELLECLIIIWTLMKLFSTVKKKL